METSKSIQHGENIWAMLERYKAEISDLRIQHSTAGDILLNYVEISKEKCSPLHKKLYNDIAAEISVIAEQMQTDPDPEEAERIVRILIGAPPFEREDSDEAIALMMSSVEGLAKPLIPYLQKSIREELGEFYGNKDDPKGMLQGQREVYMALKNINNKKENLFQKFFGKTGGK